MKIIDACEDIGGRLVRIQDKQLEERREVAKHIITLSSAILVLTVSLCTLALNHSKTIPDPGLLGSVWFGLVISLISSVLSLWWQIGARSYYLNVWNQGESLNKTLNENPSRAPADEALFIAKEAILISQTALHQTLKFDKRSRSALTVSLGFLLTSMVDLAFYGTRLFK